MAETGTQRRRPVAEPADPTCLFNRPLLSSRERWQDMVRLGADLAFETDCHGRFSLVAPLDALGWPEGALVGQPAEIVLVPDVRGVSLTPFVPQRPIKACRVWVRRYDGSAACLSFSTAPLPDATSRTGGVRGIAFDVTEYHLHAAHLAGALRRGEVLDFILWCVAQEVMAPRMMDAALSALINALAADGAAVVAASSHGAPTVLHVSGSGSDAVWASALDLVAGQGIEPKQTTSLDGRSVLAVACRTRFDAKAVLVVWRTVEPRTWDKDDTLLARSAGGIIRMILEHEAIEHEMGRQARTDPLTGLLNRRAFLEEMQRHTDRLDSENEPGTLMFVDMDHFKLLNDQLGHEAGDEALRLTAALLRKTVRPTDLVARF